MGTAKSGRGMSANTDLNFLDWLCHGEDDAKRRGVLGATRQWRDVRRTANRTCKMADDLTKTGKADDSRINIHQDYELQYWSRTLGVTPERLREAVRAVGPMVRDVKRHLGIYT